MKRKTIQSNPLDALSGKSNKKHIDTSNKMVYAKSKVIVKKNIKKETQLMAKDETALDILDNEIGSKDKKPAAKKSKKLTPKSLHEQLALETVNKWSTWSAAAGFIPMPAVDEVHIPSPTSMLPPELLQIICPSPNILMLCKLFA